MLHALPNELLLLVASPLAARDLGSLILADRHLCSLLTPAITERARQDYRALHHAVIHGYHDVLRHLLSHGVPASIAKRNHTALVEAVRRGDEIAVRLLLDHGASPEGAPRVPGRHLQQTPLVLAARGTSEEIVRMLLESGADPNRMALGSWRGVLPRTMVLLTRGHGIRSEGWEERVREMLVQYGGL